MKAFDIQDGYFKGNPQRAPEVQEPYLVNFKGKYMYCQELTQHDSTIPGTLSLKCLYSENLYLLTSLTSRYGLSPAEELKMGLSSTNHSDSLHPKPACTVEPPSESGSIPVPMSTPGGWTGLGCALGTGIF